jgi:serine/threonine protein kinase
VKMEFTTKPGFSIFDEFNSMKAIGKNTNIIEYIEYVTKIEKKLNLDGMNEDIDEVVDVQNHYLAFEFAENRSLIEYVNSMKEKIDQSWLKRWFRQIVAGLKHI